MAKLSRTQKYQELRDHLDEETTQAHATPVKAARLSRVQSSSNSLPHAAKAYFPHEETAPKPAEPDLPTSPVIDELLGEVKQYNIDNGNRYTDDTQINILKQLDQPETDKERRKAHVLPMEEPREDFGSTMKMPRTTREITLNLEEPKEEEPAARETLLEKTANRRIVLTAGDIRADEFEENDQLDVLTTRKPEPETHPVRKEKAETPRKKKKKKKVRPAAAAGIKKESSSSRNRKPGDTEDMPSAKMRIRVEDYDEELPARKQKNSSRTLNIVLFLLIVALIVAISFMVYFVRSLGAL